jgi:hypothetical protein
MTTDFFGVVVIDCSHRIVVNINLQGLNTGMGILGDEIGIRFCLMKNRDVEMG